MRTKEQKEKQWFEEVMSDLGIFGKEDFASENGIYLNMDVKIAWISWYTRSLVLY